MLYVHTAGYVFFALQVINDYTTPPQKELRRDLDAHMRPFINFLTHCRPLSVSMGNAIKYLKIEISKIPPDKSELEVRVTTYASFLLIGVVSTTLGEFPSNSPRDRMGVGGRPGFFDVLKGLGLSGVDTMLGGSFLRAPRGTGWVSAGDQVSSRCSKDSVTRTSTQRWECPPPSSISNIQHT